MEAQALFRKTPYITRSLVRVVVSFKRRGVVKKIGCFLIKGIATQHRSDGMVRLKIENLRHGLPPRKSLPVPSLERPFGGLKVKERKPVRSLSYESS